MSEDSPVPGVWCHVSTLGPWLDHSGDGAPQQLGVERERWIRGVPVDD